MTRRIAQLFPVVLLLALSVPLSAQQGANDELRAKAEQGDVQAQYNLGIMYDEGEGIPANSVKGYIWLSLATAQDRELAALILDIVKEQMTPADISKNPSPRIRDVGKN